jgi:hypothetical protein
MGAVGAQRITKRVYTLACKISNQLWSTEQQSISFPEHVNQCQSQRESMYSVSALI